MVFFLFLGRKRIFENVFSLALTFLNNKSIIHISKGKKRKEKNFIWFYLSSWETVHIKLGNETKWLRCFLTIIGFFQHTAKETLDRRKFLLSIHWHHKVGKEKERGV